jgi:BirA family biotin operon repressor/biotin-[acetyl-CoA-carboxylase] ligase
VLEAENPLGGAPILYVAETDTTMDDARAVLGTAPHGTALLAGYQRRGRGRRRERGWDAKPASSLLTTVVLHGLPPGVPASAVPLAAGLAVARALERILGTHESTVFLKWPNDVIVRGRKVCGILCEHRTKPSISTLVGIGLNCRQETFSPALLERGASSLHREYGWSPEPRALLEAVLGEVAALYTAAAADGRAPARGAQERGIEVGPPAAWREAVDARLYGKDRRATVIDGPGGASVSGRIRGIDEAGALVIEHEHTGELDSVYFGELRVHDEDGIGIE